MSLVCYPFPVASDYWLPLKTKTNTKSETKLPTKDDIAGIVGQAEIPAKPEEPKQESKPEEKVPAAKVLTATTIGGLPVVKATERPKMLNILIYGDSGIGKTVLTGSASVVEEMSPVLHFDIEGGTLSLETRYPDVEIVRIKGIKQMQKAYDDLFTGKFKYRTVVIDSLTEVQKLFMGEIMSDVHSADSDRDPDVPGMYEWNKNTEQVRKLVRAFRDLPLNTIFTALADEKRDKNNVPRTVPSFSNKLIGEVPALVDVVAYMYTKRVSPTELKRLLLTQKTDREVAKDRTDRLPPVVEEPTMELIYRTVYGPSHKP